MGRTSVRAAVDNRGGGGGEVNSTRDSGESDCRLMQPRYGVLVADASG